MDIINKIFIKNTKMRKIFLIDKKNCPAVYIAFTRK